MRTKSNVRFLIACLIWAITLTAAYSQTVTADVNGTVTGPKGAPFPNANVTVTNVDTGVAVSSVTNGRGIYSVRFLQVGNYNVTIAAKGFETNLVGPIVLLSGQIAKIDSRLTAGSESVIVKAVGNFQPLMNTQNGMVDNVINTNETTTTSIGGLQQARDAMDPSRTNPPDYNKAVAILLKATQSQSSESVLWFELAHAYIGLKKYDQAVAALHKTVDLNNSRKASRGTNGSTYNELGEALADMGKVADASAAYEEAAKSNPPSAGMYYRNEASTLYTAGSTDFANQAADYTGAVTAANKAIAAEPNNPIPYYIKGQALVVQSTADPKTGKLIAPPGCAEAYKKYLQIAPNGPYSGEIKQILASF